MAESQRTQLQDEAKILLPLTEAERHQFLVIWNDTRTAYPRERCVHELFEIRAEQTPDAIALVCSDEQITYHELNQQANCLAHYLRSLGVGCETMVGLCLERSLEMVVGLLAILKAGGAYVPLDPTYPLERLTFMATDARLVLLLTQSHLADRLPGYIGHIVTLDADREAIARQRTANVSSDVHPTNLAYVIYTSGSMGKPKGVAVTHRSIVRLVQKTNYVRLTADEVFLQLAPVAFDASTFEIWGCLLNGARLVLSVAHTPTLAELANILKRYQVTTLWLTAGLFHQMVEEQSRALSPLHQLLAGGDVLSVLHVCQALAHLRTGQLINGYGPTENTTFTCTYAMAGAHEFTGSVPIGRPIANTLVYVLDAALHLLPIGAPGELCIGGDGLARGYLNRPDLTAEKFVPHPFSQEPGARLYKTGDLVRYLTDGTIEFLGRIDQQVKIRGFRIEPGEIEVVLGQHPSVLSCIVLACEEELGEKRLVAYVVPRNNAALSGKQLLDYLRQRIPDYMLPAAFLLLETLPLTPNGKVDRQKLPTPDWTRPERTDAYVVPHTPIERELARICSDVLGVGQIGIHDNFFELGGHSLLATQILSRVRKRFHIELSLRSLFEKPTITGLAQQIEDTHHRIQSSQLALLQPAPRTEHILLSHAQQRLWFLDQLVPNNPFYNVFTVLHLSGRLNVTVLEQSLREIIHRHEILRTTFVAIDGLPGQVIAPTLPLPLTIVDLSAFAEPARAVEAQQLISEEVRRPFNLAQSPLLRFLLLRQDRREHILLLTMHHIITDGWSMSILLHELETLYAAYTCGQPSPLPELPVQYADFAHWQRQWLQDEVLEPQLAYWKQQLSGTPVISSLPTDRPRPDFQTFRGARQTFALSGNLTESLKTLSHREGVTLFMTLLAAFHVLLARYTGQDDIVVGTPIANRTQAETEEMLGFFVNTLMLRTDLSGNPPFRELLGRVREMALDAYAHQDLPFEQVVEAMQIVRNPAYNPLFQVLFVLQNAPMPSLELEDLTLRPLEVENGTALFDITLEFTETAEGLHGLLEYNSDLFEAQTIARMVGQLQKLLKEIVNAPEQRIKMLPLLTEEERHLLLITWNDTRADYPRDQCVHHLFEAQVKRIPDTVAVVFEDEYITYAELNRRANQVAHYLQTLGVGPEVLVGICVERSLKMLVGLLGILKAGGAYVPLDPTYPKERLAFLLADTQIPVLLTVQRLIPSLPAQNTIPVCLDTEIEFITQESHENLSPAGTSDTLAYVMYTSGSTGQPKGVSVTHRNIVRLVKETNYATLTSSEVFLQFAPISFDASTFEIWGCLLNGARLVIFPPHTPTLEGLGHALNWHQISVLWLTAGLFHQMVDHQEESLRQVRQLLAGGDVLSASHINKLVEVPGACQLSNGYGPTEATTFTCCYRVTEQGKLRGSAPIGRPIANTQVYMLDSHLHPVPIGVPGELYIGGDGVARGYLNRPDLTAERFLPDPWSAVPGARLYKTGDLTRYRNDGVIEFLGRLDSQVKIRGFRIEPGEIEIALSHHPAVREAVVLAQNDTSGEKRLVAYLVPDQQHTPSMRDLRRYLQETLPDYMIPSAFLSLDSLPITSIGKIDRQALPSPDWTRPERTDDYIAPLSPVEEDLAQIYADVLGVEQIGIHDNFFELGGHSLLATQVLSRVRERFHIELPLRSLFKEPTIAGLALQVLQVQEEQGQRSNTVPDTITLQQAEELMVNLDHLSDEEVDSLLSTMPTRDETDL